MLFRSKPRKHFSYKMHVAKELAAKLKEKNITCVQTDKKMSIRLEYYGVTKCNKYLLQKNQLDSNHKDNVTISYKNRVVYSARVTKLNKI